MPRDAQGNYISLEHALRGFCTKRISMTCALCGVLIFDETSKADDQKIKGTHHRSIRATVKHFREFHPLNSLGLRPDNS